jgi:hypothetical protein
MRKANQLKYYVYISETKVDMLYSQIPKNWLLKTFNRFNIEIKSPIGNFRFTNKPIDESLITKLGKVIDYLNSQSLVGTVEEPKDYIYGVLPLETGIPHDPYDSFIICDFFDFALWGNRKLRLSLVGSLQHIIGESMEPKRKKGNYSALRHIIELVKSVERENISSIGLQEAEQYVAYKTKPDREWLIRNNTVSRLTRTLSYFLTYPQRDYEFLAKVLITERDEAGALGIIASPIYVAQ